MTDTQLSKYSDSHCYHTNKTQNHTIRVYSYDSSLNYKHVHLQLNWSVLSCRHQVRPSLQSSSYRNQVDRTSLLPMQSINLTFSHLLSSPSSPSFSIFTLPQLPFHPSPFPSLQTYPFPSFLFHSIFYLLLLQPFPHGNSLSNPSSGRV